MGAKFLPHNLAVQKLETSVQRKLKKKKKDEDTSAKKDEESSEEEDSKISAARTPAKRKLEQDRADAESKKKRKNKVRASAHTNCLLVADFLCVSPFSHTGT